MHAKTSNTINSLDKVIGNLDAFEQSILKDITRLGKQVAQSKAKGSLRKGIEIQTENSHKKDLVADKPYATFVENGRGSIKAKNKKVLRFVVNGKVIFAKSVGPAKPRPFMKPAGKSMREQAGKIIQDNWKKVF